jgi:HTH-type transcriptional regulator/antitoxin HigA
MENLEYKTESEYDKAMVEIDRLMRKGESNLSDSELGKIRTMAVAAQALNRSIITLNRQGRWKE